jgi:hypothetical protein
MPGSRTAVAIVNTSPDTIDVLRDALERAGFVVVSCFTHDIRDGRLDFEAFMRTHAPSVIAYDLAPPYERNHMLYQHVRGMEAVRDVQFVITAPNAVQAQKLIGKDEHVYEVVGKEEDLGRIVDAIKEASRARPTR